MTRDELTRKILVNQTRQGPDLEGDRRRDRRRLGGLSDRRADGSDEAAPGAGRARGEAFRARRG